MRQVLFSWVGSRDLQLSLEDQAGALASTIEMPDLGITEAVLLRDPKGDDSALYSRTSLDRYTEWLRQRTGVPVEAVDAPLPNPMDFGAIYRHVRAVLERSGMAGARRTFNLSSGTPAMTAVWILLGRGIHPARLTNSSVEAGVVEAKVPFDLHADYLPELRRATERRLIGLGAGEAHGHFGDLQFRSEAMRRAIARARKVARFDVPVLIRGESGTGKELLAQAIHLESPRAKTGRFQAVNCGAIPSELLESTLFGHVRGAFTGANRDHEGLFQSAHGGTLFLDEIGDLPLNAQVKLLRALQEGEIVPVGATQPRNVDVRVVAASHKDLQGMVADGRFREDLFYRLAVAVLRVPPLRERGDDLQLLTDVFLEEANRLGQAHTGYREKTLTAAARRKLVAHSWPGNVRELQNTLTRAAIWSDKARVGPDDIEFVEARPVGRILERPLHEGFRVREVLAEVQRHYLARALKAGGTKAEAAKLLGIGRQSVLDWSKRLGLSDG